MLIVTLAALALTPANVPKSAVADIAAVNQDWVEGLKSGDADRIVLAYADDALFVLTDGKVLKGRAAIRDLYAKGMNPKTRVSAAGVDSEGELLSGSGDICEWGSAWASANRANGDPAKRSGAYLTVWHKGADGHWRISKNIAF